MSKTKVYSGQSFLNKVVEATGSLDNAFAMGLLNGRSITDEYIVSEALLSTSKTNFGVVAFFRERKPATAITESHKAIIPANGGIGFMKIGTTFIV